MEKVKRTSLLLLSAGLFDGFLDAWQIGLVAGGATFGMLECSFLRIPFV